MVFESKFRYCKKAQFTLEVWGINFVCYFYGVKGKKLISKTRFQPILRFWKSVKNPHYKSDTSKNNFEARTFFPFSQKIKESRNMKKKDKIFALSKLLLPLGANKLIFWYFQPAATVKTKIKVFI